MKEALTVINSFEKKVIQTLSSKTIAFGLVAAINLASLSLVAKSFNLEELGKYFILITLGGFISLLDLGAGFSAALIGRERQLSNIETSRYLKNAVFRIARLGPIFLMLAILFGYPFADYFLKSHDLVILFSTMTVVIGGFVNCLFSPFYQSWISRGFVQKLILLDTSKAIINFSGILLACWIDSFYLLVFAWTVSLTLPSLLCFFPDIRRVVFDKNFLTEFEKHDYAQSGYWFQMSTIVGASGLLLQSFVVSLLLGNSAVAIFQMLIRINIVIKSLLGTIWLVIWPTISSELDFVRSLRQVYRLKVMVYFAGVVIGLSYFLTAEWLFQTFFDIQIERGALTLLALSALIILYSLETINSAIVNTLELQKTKALVLLTSLVVNLLIGYFLVPSFGYSGAILANLLSYGIFYVFPILILSNRRSRLAREKYWKF